METLNSIGRPIYKNQEVPSQVVEKLANFSNEIKLELFLLLSLRGYSCAAISRAYGCNVKYVQEKVRIARKMYPRCPE